MAAVTFTNPAYLWVLLVIPIIVIVHILTLKRTKDEALEFSNFEAVEKVLRGELSSKPYKILRHKNIFLLFLRIVTYTLLVFSAAGTTVWYTGMASNFDFVLAIDTSFSMIADDFNISRLDAAKNASKIFADSVPEGTEIGIVSLSSTTFIDNELTSDKERIKSVISSLEVKEGGGTNLGDGIITSTNLLVHEGSGKTLNAIILLTDGQSNTGTPLSIAVDYARNKGIIIHTIGIGTEEGGKLLSLDVVSKLDEESLMAIADYTNGRYFRAKNVEDLKNSFKQIASFKERRMSIDISWVLLIIGLSLLSMEWILMRTIYRTIP
jgi:Ca-activated chloride channel homolog